MEHYRPCQRALLAALVSAMLGCSSGGSTDEGLPGPTRFTVSTNVSTCGGITPARLQVAEGQSATLALTPDAGFAVATASGCGGQLSDNIYTLGSISSDCVVDVTFAPTGEITVPPAPSLTFDYAPTKRLRFSWRDGASETGYLLLENAGDGSGYSEVATLPADTIAYDHSVFLPGRINASYMLQACNSAGCNASAPQYVEAADLDAAVGYVKAAVPGQNRTGWSVALSADGETMAVGAPGDSSPTIGVNNGYGQSSLPLPGSGAVYLYRIVNGAWVQQAYIKASNTGAEDEFGASVALSADGTTLVVGATGEASAATGVNGDQLNEVAPRSGAAYIFTRSSTGWVQQAYLKASNTAAGDLFGYATAVSGNGNTVAIGAYGKDSAYVFSRNGSNWAEQALIRGDNTEQGDNFGHSISLSADGSTLAVGAFTESGDGRTNNNNSPESGAVYVFTRSGGVWDEQAYVKAATPSINSHFGWSIALAGDGNTLAVGARAESRGATGIDGDQQNNLTPMSGAAYVFSRAGGDWQQQAYVKAANTAENALFGQSVSLSADGTMLAVGAHSESTDMLGIHERPLTSNINMPTSGAAYVFNRGTGNWEQMAYIKPPRASEEAIFGWSTALAGDGSTLAVGAYRETSEAIGVNGNAEDQAAPVNVGAVFVY